MLNFPFSRCRHSTLTHKRKPHPFPNDFHVLHHRRRAPSPFFIAAHTRPEAARRIALRMSERMHFKCNRRRNLIEQKGTNELLLCMQAARSSAAFFNLDFTIRIHNNAFLYSCCLRLLHSFSMLVCVCVCILRPE